jgi:hypothetical protein
MKPVSPNQPDDCLGGIGGVGLAVPWETLDTSFKKGDEIDAFINVSLLATFLLW